jgi:hypothetical protein
VRYDRSVRHALEHAARELDYRMDENSDYQVTIFADASRSQYSQNLAYEPGAYAIAYRLPGEAHPLRNPFLVRAW